jgi:hypothetical protein
MCLSTPKISAAPQIFASTDNSEAVRQADIEARLRKRRAGAAANILTSSSGIPSSPKLGSAA